MLPPSFRHRVGERRTRVGNRARDRDHPAAGRRRVFAAALAVAGRDRGRLAGGRAVPVHRRDRRHADFPARGVRAAGAARMPGGVQPCQQRPVLGPEAASRPGGSLGPGRGPDPVAMGSGRHRDRPGARYSVRGRRRDSDGDGMARPFPRLAGYRAGWRADGHARGHLRGAVATRLCRCHSLLHRYWADRLGPGAGAGGAGSAHLARRQRHRAASRPRARWWSRAAAAARASNTAGPQAAAGACLDGAGHRRSPTPAAPARPLHRRRRWQRHDLDRSFRPGAGTGSLCQPLSGGRDRPLADRVPAFVPRDAGQ